jgi:hypothetical protein
MCICKEYYSAASQQNIANSFWGKPISQHCVRDFLRGKRDGRMKCEHVRYLKGAKLYVDDALVILMGQVNAEMEQ